MNSKPILLFLFLCFTLTARSALAEEAIKIGVSLPLTGPASTYGEDVKHVLLFYNEELTDGSYELVFEDDKCDGKEAVNIAHRFTTLTKVPYVLGLPCSGALLSAAPIYNKGHTIVISSLAAAPAISQAGDYIFRTRPTSTDAAKLLFSHVYRRHSRIGLLTEETDFALGNTGAFNAAAQGSTAAIVEERFLPGTGDFKSLLLNLKNKDISALVISTQTEHSAAQIIKQLAEMKWGVDRYGFIFPGSPTFLRLVGDLANGIDYVTLPSPAEHTDPEVRQLYLKFIRTYGELNSIDFTFTTTVEAFNALDQAIRSGDEVTLALHSLTFSGALLSKFTFDNNGDIQGMNHTLRTIRHGKISRIGVH